MEFLNTYDTKCTRPSICDILEFDIRNGNIPIEEIEAAIDYLKNGKAVVPAEFIKHNKGAVMDDLCIVLNWVIEQEEFPQSWADGVRTSIHKSGAISDHMITGALSGFQSSKKYLKLLRNGDWTLLMRPS